MRIAYIDYIKCFAMYLCIWGHMLQNGTMCLNTIDWQNDKLFLFIYSFHMPVLFFISGLLFKVNHFPSFFDLLKRKAKTLLLPSYTWNYTIYFVILILQVFSFQVDLPNRSRFAPYWFIMALFGCCVVTWLFVKIPYKKIISIPLLLLCSILSPMADYCYFNSFLPFFVAGCLLSDIFLTDEKSALSIKEHVWGGYLLSYF